MASPFGMPAADDLGLKRLAGLSSGELRTEWQRLYEVAAPRCLSRDLLVRGIAYRIQERAYGGLSRALHRRLQQVEQAPIDEGEGSSVSRCALKPGARLLREWHGGTHAVQVLENGFIYRDERFRSLSQIARLITGAHWSGPRFFGLGRSGRPSLDRAIDE